MSVQLKEVLNRELTNRRETIQSVAKKCRIPLSTLANWKNGMLPNAKNLHFLKALSEHFEISLSELLFNTKEERSETAILFTSSFVDEQRRYRLVVEKLPK